MELPVPGKQHMEDFCFDLVEYQIVRNNQVINVAKGLSNDENGKPYVHFFHGVDIVLGDILKSTNEDFTVKRLETDTYHGEPQLTRVYY